MSKFKSLYLLSLIVLSATGQCHAEAPAQTMPVMEEVDINKVSEAFGNFIGRNLNPPGLKFNVDLVVKGIRDGAEGKPGPMTDQEYEQAMTKLQIIAFQKLAETNLENANKFLKENATKGGVIEIEPGKLQYMIIQKGTGAAVKEHDTPTIEYKGTYLDGTVFGSSDETGGPSEISLDQTIPGFSKGLLGMHEGEKRKIYIHPELGYGTSGHLQPNSLLIFDVEVVNATKAPSTEEPSSDQGE